MGYMERVKIEIEEKPKKQSVVCFPTGCCLLDRVLGGGWPEGRIVNIVGDSSTGKTLQAIEAAANFAFKYPSGLIRYREAEEAFDRPYAKSLGMPLKRVDFGEGFDVDTVEDFYNDVVAF